MTVTAPPMTQLQLRDFIRVYQHDTRDILEAVKGLEGWRKHSWYNAASRSSHSEAEKELDVRNLDDQPDLAVACGKLGHASLKAYADELLPHAMVTAISHPRLNRYPTGSMMRPHVDHIHSLFDGNLKGVPVLTVLVCLNDEAEYKGGEFVVCGEPLTLPAGSVVVFPSNFMYPHEVREVLEGTRYSVVSWAW